MFFSISVWVFGGLQHCKEISNVVLHQTEKHFKMTAYNATRNMFCTKLVMCTDDFQNISWILKQRTQNWRQNWVMFTYVKILLTSLHGQQQNIVEYSVGNGKYNTTWQWGCAAILQCMVSTSTTYPPCSRAGGVSGSWQLLMLTCANHGDQWSSVSAGRTCLYTQCILSHCFHKGRVPAWKRASASIKAALKHYL
jgi:hypothetical protein